VAFGGLVKKIVGGLGASPGVAGVIGNVGQLLAETAYSAGVSGVTQNPWAGPTALQEMKDAAVRNQMAQMQQAAYAEQQARQQAIISHLEQNFPDISDPRQREGALSFLMQNGAFEWADKMSSTFANMYPEQEPAAAPTTRRVKRDGVEVSEEWSPEAKSWSVVGESPIERENAPEPLGPKDALSLAHQYETQAKPFTETALQWKRARAAFDDWSKTNNPQAKNTMISALAKTLDPTGTIRETDLARSDMGQSLIQRIEGMMQQAATGSPLPKFMADVMSQVEILMQAAAEAQQPHYDRYAGLLPGPDYPAETYLGRTPLSMVSGASRGAAAANPTGPTPLPPGVTIERISD
jgi:hypothetical protein